MSTAASRNRRQFLRFLAGSPLLAQAFAQQTSAPAGSAPAAASAFPSDPKDFLSVMDFEPFAHSKLPPAHWGYMASGVDDDLTLKANMEGFKRYQLRARRLVDVSKPDTRTEIFGSSWESPLFICPVGGHKMFHPEGEVAVARAARSKKTTQILSTVTSTPVEDVAKALGGGLWYQLYMPLKWEDTEKLIRRVEAAGCPVLVWTVDLLGGRNTETATRARRQDTRDCNVCHGPTGPGNLSTRPMFQGLSASTFNPPAANWEYVDRLKKLTQMKLVIKGIETAEDARLCREHGADAVLVSNHGGRATETGRATIEVLPEVIDAVGSQYPVFVDGGFRRGTDIYKALAIGARAVGIGRPYIYGLTSFGQAGVERVIDILRAELTMTMRQCGTPTIRDISRASIRRA
jgi:isopentenyl diphosphate isomerase/L-lactate dehydrogenase-like FMN-dependent dehydrogenase